MVGHDNSSMKVEFATVSVETTVHDNVPSCSWKLPTVVGRKGNKDGATFFLNVGKPTAVLVFSLHNKTAARRAA